MLLSWATLVPDAQGVSAIRFSAGVRIHSLRVFPTGSRPFAQADVVAQTEPDAFYFDLYLNALPTTAAAKERQKTSNSLAHTRLAYAGGQTDFSVDMGPDYTTRLLVIRGSFRRMSLAVYGTIVSEMPPPPAIYETLPLPVVDPMPLHTAFDVANMEDPTALARTLLQLISPSLPLSEVVSEALCRTETYQNGMNHDPMDGDVPDLYDLFTRTRRGWVSDEDVSKPFSELFSHAIKQEGPSNSSLISGIIRNAARWCPQVLPDLLRVLELEVNEVTFTHSSISYDTIARLNEAAANLNMSIFLNSEPFLRSLERILGDPTLEADQTALSRSLKLRLHGWHALSDALLNTRGDFKAALAFLADFVEDQSSLGVWLGYLSSDSDFLARLSENPSMSAPPPLSPEDACASHDTFVSYLRAFVGMAFTMCLLLSANRNENEALTERVLTIIRLWRSYPGYREICGRLILLPAVLSGLKAMIDGSRLTKSALIAEELLLGLSSDVQSYLQEEFIDDMQSLGTLANMSQAQDAAVRERIAIADQPLTAAIGELHKQCSTVALDGDLSRIRLSIAMIARELDESPDADMRLVVAAGEEGLGLMRTLADGLIAVGNVIAKYFRADIPLEASVDEVTEAFLATSEALHLIIHLLSLHPITGRLVRLLTSGIATVFVDSWSADMFFAPDTIGCAAVQRTRRSCGELLQAFCEQDKDGTNTTHVLRTLLPCALHSSGDPSVQISQIFYLVNQLIPTGLSLTNARRQMWTTQVIPNILSELSYFMEALDVENKVHLARLLADIDQGIVGIAEWFLRGEIRRLSIITRTLATPNSKHQLQSIRECDAHNILHMLRELLCSGSSWDWWTSVLIDDTESIELFIESLKVLSSQRLGSVHLFDIAHIVLQESTTRSLSFKEFFLLALVYCAQIPEIGHLEDLERSLDTIAAVIKTSEKNGGLSLLQKELCNLVLRYVDVADMNQSVDPGIAENILTIVEWVEDANSLAASQKFKDYTQQLTVALPSNRAERLQVLMRPCEVSLQEDEDMEMITPRLLKSTVSTSLNGIIGLLSSPPLVPSTPTMNGVELAPDLLAMATVSPSALLRSPATSTTGLTKTYSNNAFREQTQRTPSNTSRMPSMHVDDFQFSESSPTIPPATLFTPAALYPSEFMQIS